ncbi:MAG: RluA family pseudouridine synthase [Bacteroidota bacterium]
MSSSPLPKKFTFQDLILHEDESVILINKPSGIASLDDKSNRNIHFMAKDYFPDAQLCHRLDKMTSGVLIIAKSPEAYRHISLQFQNRTLRKGYRCLVEGIHRFQNRSIDLKLYVTTNKRVSVSKSQGKPALTIVNTEEVFRHYTLLHCEPRTGRMHQIRVHLATLKSPIVGDELYGGKDIFLSAFKRKYKFSGRKMEERPLNHSFLLHAYNLKFVHPTSEEEMTIEAPYPKNFQVVLKMLRKYDA